MCSIITSWYQTNRPFRAAELTITSFHICLLTMNTDSVIYIVNRSEELGDLLTTI